LLPLSNRLEAVISLYVSSISPDAIVQASWHQLGKYWKE